MPNQERRPGSSEDSREVIVVSGLPRSGTSMMMKMLQAGGVPLLTDGLRVADPDNPEGYYELERVKKLPAGDHAWLADAPGHGVKIISALLEHLPADYRYQVIFIERSIGEVLASQRKMLSRSGRPADPADDARLATFFEKHLQMVKERLQTQPNFSTLYVSHSELLRETRLAVERIVAHLERPLDREAMVGAVNPSLYRNRQGSGTGAAS
jgi:hypothetical protein